MFRHKYYRQGVITGAQIHLNVETYVGVGPVLMRNGYIFVHWLVFSGL
jgi:hypothetical protein